MMNEENMKIYIIEYLNIINLANLLSYELKLKIDIIVILLHNLSSFTELCNEIYLHITCISQRIVECEILGDKYAGNIIIIPRIPLSSSFTANLSFEFR